MQRRLVENEIIFFFAPGAIRVTAALLGICNLTSKLLNSAKCSVNGKIGKYIQTNMVNIPLEE